MDTRDLYAFTAVYQEGNLKAAAKRCFISPQGLSKLIARLEQELEVELFCRTAQGMQPTRYGTLLYQNANALISYLEQIKLGIRDEGRELFSPLNVASTLGVMDYLTIDFILAFQEAFPNIQITISECSDREVDQRLQSGEAEVGFISAPVDATQYHAEFFSSHKHCLVINKSHPLARKAHISYMDLDGEPIALEGRDFHPYHLNRNRFLRAGSKPIICMETTEIALTHKIASMNKAIGLSVDFPAWSNPYPNTVIRPFEDETCTWDTYFVYRRDRLPGKEAACFRAFAFDWLAKNRDRLFHWPQNGGK